MEIAFSVLAVFGLIICFLDWRSGMLICVLAGFLADPARKLIPGEPVFIVVLIGIFLGVILISFISRYGGFRLRSIEAWNNALKVPVSFFMVWLVVASAVSIINYGNPIIVAIGLISYLAPLPAFLLAYYYGMRSSDIYRFVRLYIIVAIAMVSGVYLSYFGYDWKVLSEIGTGVTIYEVGGILDSYPGFLRSTEGAAWHAAAATCLLLVLTVSGQSRWPKLVAAAIVILLIIAGLLTGRRKMLVEIVIFAGLYAVMLAYFRRGANKVLVIGAMTVGLLGVAALFFVQDEVSRLDPYLQRGSTVFSDVDERFGLGIRTMDWAINRFGYFGGGLGVASQGAQHFGAGSLRFGGAGEGGLGKITAELGIPGLLIIGWIIFALTRYVIRLMADVGRYRSNLAPLFYGLLAFIGANIPVFIVATQVFGDLFVLFILGWVFGFAMAIPQVIYASSEALDSNTSANEHGRLRHEIENI